MKRRLLNFLTTLSLLLCVAVAALWGRSYFHWESFVRDPYRPQSRTFHQQSFSSASGNLWVWWYEEKYHDLQHAQRMHQAHAGGAHGEAWRYWPRDVRRSGLPGIGQRFGFIYRREPFVRTRPGVAWRLAVGVPHWLPALLLTILPAARVARNLRIRRRTRGGLCSRCGYDLTGNVSGVCPEMFSVL